MRYSPAFPIPGEAGSHDTAVSPPLYLGPTFPKFCRLWMIAQEVLSVYSYSSSTPVSERVPLAFAESKYQKLLVGASTLQRDLQRTKGCTPDVMMFQ